MHEPDALQVPDWQSEAVLTVQPGSPFEMPQWPPEQVLNSHSAAAAQLWPTAPAQVLVVALHSPVAHVGAMVVTEQRPVCSPSTGMAAPLASRGTHVSAARLQNDVESQSPSAQQLPGVEGTQAPLGAQALLTHWAAAVQLVPFEVAQVSVASLQAPLWHVALTLAWQVPSCRPSLGIAVPAASVATQVLVARLQ